jgi:hypothetical protein
MNYNTLIDDMQTYMLRTDQPYLAKIPELIQQGIIRIYNNAKDIGFELYYTVNVVPNAFLIPKPGNWQETVSLSIVAANGDNGFLQERTYEYCKTYLPNVNVTGIPKYYTDSLVAANSNSYANWLITPAANANYTVNAIYLGIPLFNGGNQTNFLTQRYPNLLLYSCLMEACLFLDNEEKRNKYEMMFGKELETINRMNVDRTTDRTVMRDKS